MVPRDLPSQVGGVLPCTLFIACFTADNVAGSDKTVEAIGKGTGTPEHVAAVCLTEMVLRMESLDSVLF